MNKQLTLWLLLCSSQIPTYGQTVYFTYDNSGNRILRDSKQLKSSNDSRSADLSSTIPTGDADVSLFMDDAQTQLTISLRKASSITGSDISLYCYGK